MKSKLTSSFNKVIFLSTAFLVSGCVSLFPETGPGPKIHELRPAHQGGHIISSSSLYLEEPDLALVLNSRAIVVEKSTDTGQKYLSNIKGHQWSEPLPKMVQRYLTNYLISEDWPRVYMDYPPGDVDYILKTNITEFNVIDPKTVKIGMFFTLIENESKKVVSAKISTQIIEAESTVTGFLEAFEKAMVGISEEFSLWLQGQMARAK